MSELNVSSHGYSFASNRLPALRGSFAIVVREAHFDVVCKIPHEVADSISWQLVRFKGLSVTNKYATVHASQATKSVFEGVTVAQIVQMDARNLWYVPVTTSHHAHTLRQRKVV